MTPFEAYRQAIHRARPVGLTGRVSGVRGLTASVADFAAPVGALCRIHRPGADVEARVIGFADDRTLVMPLGGMAGIRRGDRVVCASTEQTVGFSETMLGRVLDGRGRAIDDGPDIRADRTVPLWPAPIPALRRRRIDEPMATGVRAIDGLLSVGRGQRMAIFSGSGVGKSVLLGMIARAAEADAAVIALIGERGREVRDFIERDLGDAGLRKSVVVVATSDEPPLVRVQAAAVASAIAEALRDRGGDVVLLMDSLTRLATAQRQIGLVAGEPPAARGYTPSVFNLLPELLERAGRTAEGSVTGFYTTLVEADDAGDPVCDAVRAASDGHVRLSRELANRGHYPAVDVLRSVSRVMRDVADDAHRRTAAEVRRLMALHADIEEMVNLGAYQPGSSPDHDQAIAAWPAIREFLAQDVDEPCPRERTLERLAELGRRLERLARNDRKHAGRGKPAPAA